MSETAVHKQKPPRYTPKQIFWHRVLVGGAAVCAAAGIVAGVAGALRAAERHLGRMPDAVFGGFHLFEVGPDTPGAEALLDATARELSRGSTVYYTGHCTGQWAYERLAETLGDRLRPMHAGTAVEF